MRAFNIPDGNILFAVSFRSIPPEAVLIGDQLPVQADLPAVVDGEPVSVEPLKQRAEIQRVQDGIDLCINLL